VPTNTRLLKTLGLPVFSDADQIASLVHVTPAFIRMVTAKPEKFYREYEIPKADGRKRQIRQPSRAVKGIQAWILRNILDKLRPSPNATAYIRGKGLIDNVLPHWGNHYFLCMDIEDFFPSVRASAILSLFVLLGYSHESAWYLTQLCTCRGSLPQGGVTSPSLSNLVAVKLDRRIAGYVGKRNIVYTRYADDMTLSSNNREALPRCKRMLVHIIEAEGFTPNMRKYRVMGPRRRCVVTGLVKNNSEVGFSIGRRTKKHMRSVMYNLLLKGKCDGKYRNRASIEGWLRFLHSVDKPSARAMDVYWNALKDRAGLREA